MQQLCLLALLGWPALAFSQAQPPCQAQLLLRQQGNLLCVTSSCRSQLAEAATYHYELRALRHSAAGGAHTSQHGSFALPAQQQVVLSQVGLQTGNHRHYHIRLLVFDATGRAVAQDSAVR